MKCSIFYIWYIVFYIFLHLRFSNHFSTLDIYIYMYIYIYIYIYLYMNKFLGPGHSRIMSAPGSGQRGVEAFFIRDSGRTFEILVERSKFRSNIRNSGRRFEIPAGRSEKSRWKIGRWNPKRTSRFSALKQTECFEYEY